MTTIDAFTLTAVPLEQYFNETYLGPATAFLWKVESSTTLSRTGTS